MLARLLGIFVVLVLLTGLLIARLAVAPTAAGIRSPMAPAPGDRVYVASSARGLVAVSGSGATERRGDLPRGLPLALASAGEVLLLGTDAGLFSSPDGGRTWRRELTGRFTAVALSGREALAGQWGKGLWRSAGTGWTQEASPPADVQFEALADDGDRAAAATLLGVLVRTPDGWDPATGPPGRMTGVELSAGRLRAVGWDGGVWQEASPTWLREEESGPGAWALSGPAVATAKGLWLDGHRVEALGGREFSAVCASGRYLYAAAARGPVFASVDGATWRTVL